MDDNFFLPFQSKYATDDHSTKEKGQEKANDVTDKRNKPDSIALQPNNAHKVEVVPRPKKKTQAAWSNKLKKMDSKVASDSDINEKVEGKKECTIDVSFSVPEVIQWSDEESGLIESHTEEGTQKELPPTLIISKSNETKQIEVSPKKSQTENLELVPDKITIEEELSNGKTQTISDAASNLDKQLTKKRPAKKKKQKKSKKKLKAVPKISETVKTFVKKARVFQVQRITRRIALLRKKKGGNQQLNKNERKIKRMLEHIDILKNINLDVYSENIAKCLVEGIKSDRTLQEKASDYKWLEISLIEKQIDSAIVEKLLKMNSFIKYLGILFSTQDTSTDKQTDTEKADQGSNEEDTIDAGIENGSVEEECDEKSDQDTEIIKEERKLENDNKGVNAKRVETDDKKNVEVGLEKIEIDTSIKEKTQLSDVEFKVVTIAEDDNVLIAGIQPENKKQKLTVVKNKNAAKKGNKITILKGADSKTKNVDKEKMDAKNKKKFADVLKKVHGTRGNRLGQRARRELWEKMFGAEAIHVKRGDKLERRGNRNRQIDMGSKKARATDKRKGFKCPRKKIKATKEEENLHPSWQAKKVQKHQTQIVEFKGNKITFDD